MWIIAFVLLIALLVFLVYQPSGTPEVPVKSQGRVGFYAKGMDAGFSLAEINLLWNAVRRARLQNPPAIYGSIEELDKAINQIAGTKKFSERKGTDSETVILKKLFNYRNQLELNKSKHRSGLKSTRNIVIGQKLTIRAEGAGIYTSRVVENSPGYLTITIPVGKPLPPGFSWRSGKMNVYFWRQNDAGYFFQSRLFEQYYDHRNLHFRMHHTDNILRSQKRRSVRAAAEIPARIYYLKSIDEANQWLESSPGASCLITDISEDGAAVRAAGRGKKNKPIKLQFKIRNEVVVVSGVVKRVQYNEEKNTSILHVEFLAPGENTRMILLSYVFDIDRKRARGENEESRETLRVISGLVPENDDEPEELTEEENPEISADPDGAEVQDAEVQDAEVDDADVEDAEVLETMDMLEEFSDDMAELESIN